MDNKIDDIKLSENEKLNIAMRYKSCESEFYLAKEFGINPECVIRIYNYCFNNDNN